MMPVEMFVERRHNANSVVRGIYPETFYLYDMNGRESLKTKIISNSKNMDIHAIIQLSLCIL